MKTLKSSFAALRNEEHFQFQNEFKALVEQHDADKLGIAPLFEKYLVLYSDEINSLNVIRKSATSDQLTAVDNERDAVFRGLSDTIKANRNHRNEAKRDAATRLSILFNQYGNVARKPYDEETAAIIKLLSELKGTYAADSATIELGEWIDDLESKNNEFDRLMKSRYSEGAAKSDVVMKAVRLEIDASVRDINNMLDALMLVNGAAAYEPFVKEYNARVDKYENTLATRRGRNTAKTSAEALN